MKKVFNYIAIIIALCIVSSCKKYLDKKPDIRLAVPTTIDGFQQLLDHSNITENAAPGIADMGSDDYYFIDSNAYASFDVQVRNAHIWKPDIWEGATANDWNDLYYLTYISNVVLEGLPNISVNTATDKDKWNAVYGQALFIRSIEHYFLEEIFGQPYNPSSASSDLGVPLKLTADLSVISPRASVQSVFTQITNDLKESAELVPATTATKNRPSKAAVYGMLARVYLTMQAYDSAAKYADKSLILNHSLVDYNTVSTLSANNPFASFAAPNDAPFETLYPAFQHGYLVFNRTTVLADSNLFKSYNVNDLRRTAFFRFTTATNTYSFKGNYTGMLGIPFSGPAVDEMYLVRAECYARMGNKDLALSDLNTLMVQRWKNNGTWVPFSAPTADDALVIILRERRKELVIRGLRWTDLRRLNQDPRFAITITRRVGSQTYMLSPNDKKYTYPIPVNEIQLTGIQQNPR